MLEDRSRPRKSLEEDVAEDDDAREERDGERDDDAEREGCNTERKSSCILPTSSWTTSSTISVFLLKEKPHITQ